MSEYIIMTDSSCDLPNAIVQELGLEVLPLSFIIDGQTYHNYPDNREMSPKEFYDKLKNGSLATTNAVNMNQAMEAIEAAVKTGKDVLVLGFSSGLSATCASFQMAAEELAPQYPDRKIFVVDTLCASSGQGLIVYLAGKLRQEGKSIEEVRDWVEANKLRVCHWVTPNDLFFLKRGGRVSAATAVVGTMLQIKPIINVDNDGKLATVDKARGRKTALEYLVKKVGEQGVNLENQTVFFSHSDCLEDMQWMANEVKKRYGVKETVICDIGPVIGAHTGPGCAVVFFLGNQR